MEEFLNNIFSKLGEAISSIGLKLVAAIVVLFVGLKICKLLMKLLSNGKAFQKLNPGVRTFINSFLRIALNVILFLTVASILGVPMTNFVAILGSAGLAIGLSLQGSLANFAGGLMILIFKPFEVGDYIESSGISGTVRDISILYTTLITPDNLRIVIPNGTIANATVKDYTSEETRRVDIPISVAYGSDVDKVEELLLSVASKTDLVLSDPAPFCRLDKHGDSSLDFALRVWTKNADYWTVYFALKEATLKALTENGIEIPFPQMDVHVSGETK